jgi:hypothetical protein
MIDAVAQIISSKPWYHIIEVAPGVCTPGRYDQKPLLDTMGFPADLTGKTVLDIGCYDGFFSFEAELRGSVCDGSHPKPLRLCDGRQLLGSKVSARSHRS